MDTIPRELLEMILEEYAHDEDKNNVLGARLTCSAFDIVLRPLAIATINLDRTRLSTLNPGSLTSFRGLDSIAGSARAIYVDLMSMRDMVDVRRMENLSGANPQLHASCARLRAEFTIGDGAFTMIEYGQYLRRMLFRCRSIEAMGVNLPCPILGKKSRVGTQILTETFEVLQARSKSGGGGNGGHGAAAAAPIKTLVLGNVTGLSVVQVLRNQTDTDPFSHVFAGLRNLSLHIHDATVANYVPDRAFARRLWAMIGLARSLETLCLTMVDESVDLASAGVRRTSLSSHMALARWQRSDYLPGPVAALPLPRLSFLRSLELHRVTIMPNDFVAMMTMVSDSLEELFLSRVLLKAEQIAAYNLGGDKILWTGKPNQRPMEDDWWMGIEVRRRVRRLRICRATALEYDHYFEEVGPVNQNGPDAFDCDDPAGLGRSLAQRFVEVALGIEQPAQADDPEGPAIFFLSRRRQEDDGLLGSLTPRRQAALRPVDVDADTFKREVRNPTSRWNEALDGVFPNRNARSVEDVAWAGDTVTQIVESNQVRS